MSLPIVWSPTANDHYLTIIKYWHDNALDYAIKLNEVVEELTERLSQFRNLCPASQKNPQFRRCTVLKRYSLICRSDMDIIWIVDFIDNKILLDY